MNGAHVNISFMAATNGKSGKCYFSQPVFMKPRYNKYLSFHQYLEEICLNVISQYFVCEIEYYRYLFIRLFRWLWQVVGRNRPFTINSRATQMVARKMVLGGPRPSRKHHQQKQKKHGKDFHLKYIFKSKDFMQEVHFLKEIFGHLNDINLCMQGKGRTINPLHSRMSGFVAKCTTLLKDLQRADN